MRSFLHTSAANSTLCVIFIEKAMFLRHVGALGRRPGAPRAGRPVKWPGLPAAPRAAAFFTEDFMVEAHPSYEAAYTAPRFWRKLARHAKGAGRQAVEKALWLYYALQDPKTPKWAKRVIYGALGYFVLPLDALPDLIPGAGYTDDVAVMAAALATVAFYIGDDVKRQAAAKLLQWFGPGHGVSGAMQE